MNDAMWAFSEAHIYTEVDSSRIDQWRRGISVLAMVQYVVCRPTLSDLVCSRNEQLRNGMSSGLDVCPPRGHNAGVDRSHYINLVEMVLLAVISERGTEHVFSFGQKSGSDGFN